MNARVRIGKVTLKRDGPVVLLHRPTNNRQMADDYIRRCLDAQGTDIAGFAFVAWGSDMRSVAELQVWENSIPSAVVPDFVYNRLFAERIESWTLETLRRQK
jgi:hypothetical protein